MHSSRTQDYFNIAKRLLSSQELTTGPQIVRNIDVDIDKTHDLSLSELSATCFEITKFSLSGNKMTDCLLLFREQPTKEVINAITPLKDRLTSDGRLVCVVPDKPISGLDASNRMEFWSSRSLFERLIEIPSDFITRVLDIADLEQTDKFPISYQDRMAKVHIESGRHPERQVQPLDQYFEKWLSSHGVVSPILLLGERGSGKSWQLAHFAQRAASLNSIDPWKYGPAFFIKLSVLVDMVEQASSATPVLLQYLKQYYSIVSTPLLGTSVIGSLIGIGHTVICVDGFDEMDLMPSDSQVRSRLTELLLILSKKCRFVMSCRQGHFSSLTSLISMKAWGDANIGETFQVLELLPFDENRIKAYVGSAKTGHEKELKHLVGLYRGGVTSKWMQAALRRCAQHPGLLAQLVEDITHGVEEPLHLIENAILGTFVYFNVRKGRTQDEFLSTDGEWKPLDENTRIEIIGAIAWYMAERNIRTLDLAKLPPRLKLLYGVTEDRIVRDLRSQSVFDLADAGDEQLLGNEYASPVSDDERVDSNSSSETEFTLSELELMVPKPKPSLVTFTLRLDQVKRTSGFEKSVAGSYFLANHISRSMTSLSPLGELPPEVKFRYLGRVALDSLQSEMLGEMMKTVDGGLKALGCQAWDFIRSLAAKGSYRLYSPWYRHLVKNLENTGCLSPRAAAMCEPWTPEIRRVTTSPNLARDYSMVVVPPVDFAPDAAPFLMGVHEVTNLQYSCFVFGDTVMGNTDCTIKGSEWSVTRVTKAGGGHRANLSANQKLTNEYHLFFWLQTKKRKSDGGAVSEAGSEFEYRPPEDILLQPVTYISWFAAAAFCDWLSVGNNYKRCYEADLARALNGVQNDDSDFESRKGFRLPTRPEWKWSAMCGYDDVNSPWELHPYHIPRKDREKLSDVRHDSSLSKACGLYKSEQKVMRKILMGSGKQAREVLFDEANIFGVAGLIGNVREWCHDRSSRTEQRSREHLISGATGYLGKSTLNFDYEAELFPRNTNPDVGFRVACSLDATEVALLRDREAAIANLPEIPPDNDTSLS